MKASEDLFLLIKSLSRREKSYFKRFSNLHSGNPDKQYLKLFTAVDRLKIYDEKVLRKRLAGDKLLKHLSHEKAYLYKLILRSLAAYHADNTVEKKLTTLREHAELLASRRLFGGALKLIEKGLKEGRRHESFSVWLELIDLKIRVYDMGWKAQRTEEVDAMHKERAQVMDMMKNLDDYVRLRFRVFDIQDESGFVDESGQNEEYGRLQEHPLLQEETRAISLRAKERYFYIRNLMRFLHRDFDEWHQHYRNYIVFVEEHEWLFSSSRRSQLYGNFMLACIKARDRKGFEDTLAKMESVIAQDTYQEPAQRAIVYTRVLELHSAMGDFDQGMEFVPQLQEHLEHVGEHLPTFSLELAYQALGRIYMETGHYREALEWMERYFRLEDINTHNPVYFVFKTLQTLCHYELGNFSLVDHELRSIYRMLRKRNSLGPFQRHFLKFITKLPQALNNQDVRPLLARLRDELSIMASNRNENMILEFYHFIPWLDSKIQERPFQELVREYLESPSVEA